MSLATAIQVVLLGVVIFVFLLSFCGLLQKIRKTYENEQLLAQRLATRRTVERVYRDSDSSTYAFSLEDGNGIFPCAPPPYTEQLNEEPPRYEDIIKIQMDTDQVNHNGTSRGQQRAEAVGNYNTPTTSNANYIENGTASVYSISASTE